MRKSLVIVESPAKAKTINKYLGNHFVVKSSIGHIRDLPTSGSGNKKKPRATSIKGTSSALSPEEKIAAKKQQERKLLIARMGIDPNHNWEAQYKILPGKTKVVAELKALAKDAEIIYLATDMDREGEAIAWHLQEIIGAKEHNFKRVVFNEITQQSIKKAFSETLLLDKNKINAQQARRFLDRIVGYMISPLLWAKIARGLSAGRVQSVALRLVVERENEIRMFQSQEYWELFADLKTDNGKKVRFQVTKHNAKPLKLSSQQEAEQALTVLKASDYRTKTIESKPNQSKAPPPFITSTLQQAASTRLGFSVKKTMMLAQRLYEQGYITYMRTDSTNLSQEAIAQCRDYITAHYAKGYLPETPNFYVSKKAAQEAHEAIRPSNLLLPKDHIEKLPVDAQKLYDLIWRQFVACQMTPACYLTTTVIAGAQSYELKVRGRVQQFDGFTKVLPAQGKKQEDVFLPAMREGEILHLDKLDSSQLFTKPPARFSEAGLVKELEKRAIGRPSTYASIISTIQERGYVSLKNRRFYAEKIGDIVATRLVESFPELMDFNFTAKMESNLDEIAKGHIDWKQLLDDFYQDFIKKLDQANAESGGMRANQAVSTEILCPNCGRKMQIRTGSTGVFLGCSGYHLPPKERCKTTMNLIPGEFVNVKDDVDEAAFNAQLAKHRCARCQATMDAYLLDEERRVHICGNNPDCPGYEIEEGTFKIKGQTEESVTLACDKCNGTMQLRKGRFGPYFACTNEHCANTRKVLKNGQPAPPKMTPVPMPDLKCEQVDDTYILRDGASGLFLAASSFPKKRETRAPLIAELLPYKDQIDSKYHFLLNAPVTDPKGNPSIVRFSRKLKQQYVMSEEKGKPTGWRAFYEDGHWRMMDDKGS